MNVHYEQYIMQSYSTTPYLHSDFLGEENAASAGQVKENENESCPSKLMIKVRRSRTPNPNPNPTSNTNPNS